MDIFFSMRRESDNCRIAQCQNLTQIFAIIDGDFKQVHYDMEKYGWDGIALRVADVYENLKK